METRKTAVGELKERRERLERQLEICRTGYSISVAAAIAVLIIAPLLVWWLGHDLSAALVVYLAVPPATAFWFRTRIRDVEHVFQDLDSELDLHRSKADNKEVRRRRDLSMWKPYRQSKRWKLSSLTEETLESRTIRLGVVLGVSRS